MTMEEVRRKNFDGRSTREEERENRYEKRGKGEEIRYKK